jgi:hypothetical protein
MVPLKTGWATLGPLGAGEVSQPSYLIGRSEVWLPRPDPLFLCCRNKGVDALAVGQGNDPIVGFCVDACRYKRGAISSPGRCSMDG